MPQRELWRIETDGNFSAQSGGLRLVVRAADGCARFLILKDRAGTESSSAAMLASGTEADVRAAIEAAERMLARFELHPAA